MKHLGDITKIDGHTAPMVDIICGGSPCQDLSVAGARKGLQHSDLGDGETTRSGLFMEQIRVFKEMRDECVKQLRMRGSNVDVRNVRPRFFIWENVPGALSSPGGARKGQDFRCVLEEVCRIADKTAVIPMPEKGWSNSGCILGDGWSVAWRVHDSQFWGVPQRRRRIALVADFGGSSAPEILFEREGLPRNIDESKPTGEKVAKGNGTGAFEPDSTSYTIKVRGGCEIDSLGKRAGKGALIQKEKSATLGVGQDQTLMVFGLDRASFNQGKNAQYDFSVQEELAQTVVAKGPGGVLVKR